MLPKPNTALRLLNPFQLHELMLDSTKKAGIDYLIVDVRRTDIDERPNNIMIPSAINIPAQTFSNTVPTLFELLSKAPIVVFHCSASRGRGPRCAQWYADELERRGCTTSESVILEGGIKAWQQQYPDLVQHLALK